MQGAQAVCPKASRLRSRSARTPTHVASMLSSRFGHGLSSGLQWPGPSLPSFVSLPLSHSHSLSPSQVNSACSLAACCAGRRAVSAPQLSSCLSHPLQHALPSLRPTPTGLWIPAVLQALQEKTALLSSFLQPLCLHPSAPPLSQAFFADPQACPPVSSPAVQPLPQMGSLGDNATSSKLLQGGEHTAPG